MTKNKLTINDIQKALLSNTHFIKEPEPEKQQDSLLVYSKNSKGEVSANHDFQIDQKTLQKFKILSAYLKVDHNELINNALSHYLYLKSQQLEQAMFKLTEE